VIRDGVDGLLVDPRDPEKLGIAILTILQDKQRAAEFAGNGLARVRDRYSMERLAAEDMAGLYRLVIDSRRRKVLLELDS
jgi:glycosyltransferase involved in cell wall biosynthesis